MQHHATRAMERSRLATSARTEAEAWSDMFEALAELLESVEVGEPELGHRLAIISMKAACKHHFRLAQKPDTAWLDRAAAHDFNDES